MSTLIWKELRENLKWALLAMLVLGGAELYALFHMPGGVPDTVFNEGMTLTQNSFLTVTTFGSAIIGFCLGLLQIVPELQRDRWAVLLHRPMTRGNILWGKIAAGLLLYAVAVLPPYLICVWLVATPGHFISPFVPGLTLPSIADTAAGLVYYFAALITALHRGGLAPLRGLPVLAAIHFSYLVVGADEFSEALWAVILMAVAACIAAWGTIHNIDSFGARPWPGRLCFLVVAFFGICGVADLVEFVLNSGRHYNNDRSDYVLSDADRPLKVTYLHDVPSVQELDGSTPASADFQSDRIREHTRQLNYCSSYIGDSHQWNPPWFREGYRSMKRYIRPGNAYRYPQIEQWYYLVEERSFVGVSYPKKVAAGRLEQRGFQPFSATPIPLAHDVTVSAAERDSYYLFGSTGLQYANVARRFIKNLALPLPGPVSGVTSIYLRENHVPLIAAALSTGLAIYKANDHELVTTLPYHQNVERWGAISVGSNAAEDRFYLRYSPSGWIPEEEKSKMPSFMEVVDARGTLLQSYTLPPLRNIPKPRRWIDSAGQCLQAPVIFFGNLLYQKVGTKWGIIQAQEIIPGPFDDNSPPTRKTAACLALLSLLCAGVTLYRARRVQMPWAQASAWAAFALAFNLAGLLVFRLVADWPHLVPCTGCGHSRPVDGEHCPHCARDWPPPNSTGTEIVDYPNLNGFETKPAA